MNLRKDHYRTAPAPVRALSPPRARCTHTLPRRARWCGHGARPKGLSNSGHDGRAEGGERGEVRGRPTCLAPRLRPRDGGRRSSLSSSLFFSLSPTTATRLRARPGPGLGPRQPAALARNRKLRPAPDGAERAASRVRTTRLAPPEPLAGCSKSPPPATATAGRPEVSSPRYTHSLSSPNQGAQTKQKIQLLAVDHSAHASMKNAASCEK